MTQQHSNKGLVRIFSARACAAPLEKAAQLFEQATGIAVEISVCNRHCARPVAEEATGETGGDDFLIEITEEGIHDLAISGAEYLLDDGEVRGIIRKGKRRTIGYRTSALLVPAGNPKNIHFVQDIARPGVRIAVSVIDCLKGLWEDICGRLGLVEPIRSNITYHANGCIAIVEAVASGQVDAAFGWTTFGYLEPDRIEIVEMPREQQVMRGTCVGMLSFARQPDPAEQLMDFLASPASRRCYREYGWIVPSE